jgi:hypothetical protein
MFVFSCPSSLVWNEETASCSSLTAKIKSERINNEKITMQYGKTKEPINYSQSKGKLLLILLLFFEFYLNLI